MAAGAFWMRRVAAFRAPTHIRLPCRLVCRVWGFLIIRQLPDGLVDPSGRFPSVPWAGGVALGDSAPCPRFCHLQDGVMLLLLQD